MTESLEVEIHPGAKREREREGMVGWKEKGKRELGKKLVFLGRVVS